MNKEEARRRQNRATRRNFFVLVILSAIGAVFYQADAPPKTDGSMIIIAVIGVLWVAWLLAELVGRLYIMLVLPVPRTNKKRSKPRWLEVASSWFC